MYVVRLFFSMAHGVSVVPVIGGCIEIPCHINGVLAFVQRYAYVIDSGFVMVYVNVDERERMFIIALMSCMDDLDVSGNLFISVKKVYIFVYVRAYSLIGVHEVEKAPVLQVAILPYSQRKPICYMPCDATR